MKAQLGPHRLHQEHCCCQHPQQQQQRAASPVFRPFGIFPLLYDLQTTIIVHHRDRSCHVGCVSSAMWLLLRRGRHLVMHGRRLLGGKLQINAEILLSGIPLITLEHVKQRRHNGPTIPWTDSARVICQRSPAFAAA